MGRALGCVTLSLLFGCGADGALSAAECGARLEREGGAPTDAHPADVLELPVVWRDPCRGALAGAGVEFSLASGDARLLIDRGESDAEGRVVAVLATGASAVEVIAREAATKRTLQFVISVHGGMAGTMGPIAGGGGGGSASGGGSGSGSATGGGSASGGGTATGGGSATGGGAGATPPVGGPRVSCSFPQGVPEPAFTGWNLTNGQVAAEVNAVMAMLSGCGVGSDCPIGDRFTDQQWFLAVATELRARGYCAGQHELGHTDELAVSSTGCAGLWYGYHVFNYGGAKVVWNGGAQRGAWSIEPQYCP